jgi:hypothetical protein
LNIWDDRDLVIDQSADEEAGMADLAVRDEGADTCSRKSASIATVSNGSGAFGGGPQATSIPDTPDKSVRPPRVPDSHIVIALRVFVKRLLLHTLTVPDTVSGFFRTPVRPTYPDTFPSLSLERGCPMSASVMDSTKEIGN